METTVKYLSALKASKTWFDDPAIQISLPPGRSPVVGDDIPPWPGCEIDLGYRRGSETCGKLRNALCQWRGGANKRLGSPPGFLARFNSPAKSLLTPLFLLVPGVFQTRRASKVQQEESILANSVKSHPWRRFVTAGSACVSLGSSFDDSLRRIGNPLDLFPPIDHSRRDHQTLPFDAILSLARKKKFHYGDKDSDNSRNSRKQVSQGFSCSRSGRDRRCDLGMRIMRPRVRSQINQTRLITDTTDWIKRRTIMVRFVSVIAGPPPPILHETRQRFDQETIAYRTCNLISYQTGYRPQQGMITFTKRYGRGSLIDNSSQEESSPSLSNFLLLSSSSFIDDLFLSIQAKVEKTFWKTLPSSRGVAWPHRRHIAGTVFNQFATFKRSKRYRSKAQHAEEQRLLPRMAATDRPWNRQ